MKSLSYWAKLHPTWARVMITGIHIVLALMAINLGALLASIEISLPSNMLYLSLIIFCTTALLYPGSSLKTRIGRKAFYFRQKSCDGLLIAVSFCMVVSLSNRYVTELPFGWSSYASVTEKLSSQRRTASEILASLEQNRHQHLSRSDKRVLKSEFKKQLKIYANAKLRGEKNEANEALLIILTIIAALGLLVLLAALSCSISCGGAEGLAIVVLIAGTIGIIIGTIAVIKSINRKKKSTQPAALTSAKQGP